MNVYFKRKFFLLNYLILKKYVILKIDLFNNIILHVCAVDDISKMIYQYYFVEN